MMNQERPVLYINILLHDASEAVKDKVAAKVKKSRIPFPLKESVANRAAALMTWDTLSTASKVVDKMGPRLCHDIPTKMSKKGIQVHVENVYSEGNYLVLELQVQHVDAIVMAEAKPKRDRKNDHTWSLTSGLFHGAFTVMGSKNRNSLERDLLPSIVQYKLSVSIREMMQAKLTAKKMTADIEIQQEEKQARFFFQMLKAVREATENAKTMKREPVVSNTVPPPPSATHVKKASFSGSMQAACASVARERSKKRSAAMATEVKRGPTVTSTEKKGPRTNSLASAVESAAVSVASSVKRGTSVASDGKVKKGTTVSTAKKGPISKSLENLSVAAERLKKRPADTATEKEGYSLASAMDAAAKSVTESVNGGATVSSDAEVRKMTSISTAVKKGPAAISNGVKTAVAKVKNRPTEKKESPADRFANAVEAAAPWLF